MSSRHHRIPDASQASFYKSFLHLNKWQYHIPSYLVQKTWNCLWLLSFSHIQYPIQQQILPLLPVSTIALLVYHHPSVELPWQPPRWPPASNLAPLWFTRQLKWSVLKIKLLDVTKCLLWVRQCTLHALSYWSSINPYTVNIVAIPILQIENWVSKRLNHLLWSPNSEILLLGLKPIQTDSTAYMLNKAYYLR